MAAKAEDDPLLESSPIDVRCLDSTGERLDRFQLRTVPTLVKKLRKHGLAEADIGSDLHVFPMALVYFDGFRLMRSLSQQGRAHQLASQNTDTDPAGL